MTLHRLYTSFANVLPLQRGDYNVANKTHDAGACKRKDTSQKIHPKKNGVRRSGQSSDVGRGVARAPRALPLRAAAPARLLRGAFHRIAQRRAEERPVLGSPARTSSSSCLYLFYNAAR